MKTKLFLLGLILQTSFVFSQNQTLILTKEQNDTWFEHLKSSKPEKQLEMIESRMLSDTSIFLMQAFPDGLTIDRFPTLDSLRKERVVGFGKPLYVFNYRNKKTKYIYFDNPIHTEPIRQIVDLMTFSNINQIEILNDEKVTSMFGTHGSCGVVILKTKDKKLWKSLDRLELSNSDFK